MALGIDINRLGPSAQAQIMRQLRQKRLQEVAATEEMKLRKYHNEPVRRGEICFDSRKEAKRYDDLMMLLSVGAISDLRLQPQFTLQESYITPQGERVRAIRYVADFSYITATGERVVEDVKCKATRTAQYEMKRKMMLDRYGIRIKEV